MATSLASKRTKSPLFESGDLSKDFGLDITVFHGGLVKSAISQQQYQSVCSSIYHQFTLTLAERINEETKLKQLLRNSKISKNEEAAEKSNQQPIRNDRRTDTDINGEDDFNDGGDHRNVETDHTDVAVKISSTANNQGAVSRLKQEKVTPGVKCDVNVEDQKFELSPSHAKSKYKEYDGRIEPSSINLSKNRVIRVNAKTFSRLMKGQIRAQLLNAREDYILTPFTGESPVNNDRERLVVAKQRTTYQTPTLASDLKVNNMLAIQRDLLGDRSVRRSVRDVLSNARDRRARVFRVQQTNYKFCDDLQFRGVDESRRTRRRVSREAGSEASCSDQVASMQRRQQSLRLRPPCVIMSNSSSITDLRHTTSVTAASETEHVFEGRLPALPVTRDTNRSTVIGHADIKLTSYLNTEASNRTRTPVFSSSYKTSLNKKTLDESKTDVVNTPSQINPDIANPDRARTSVMNADKCQLSVNMKEDRILKQENFTRDRSKLTKSAPAPHTARGQWTTGQCFGPAKPLHTMQDVTRVVKQWKDEDKTREHKLNLWRMRMTFAAIGRRDMSRSGPSKVKA